MNKVVESLLFGEQNIILLEKRIFLQLKQKNNRFIEKNTLES